MSASPDRRSFLAASAGLAFLDGLPPVSAADAKPDPDLVRLDSGIEPLVRLLEDTPREKLLEEVGSRVKKGLAYREVLAALLLAGVRNVQPRPSVGFKFHAVLVVHSAHQAAMAGPDNERWLPLFWALDNFKSAQATNAKESGWRMKPADEAKVPEAHRAREAFTRAMDGWDIEAADAATAALARTAAPGEMFDLFARYGSRDFRDIGHKIIYVANAFRTLEVIGWPHAEPVLRSLAFALLRHDGKNPAKEDLDADRPGRKNLERARNQARPRGVLDKPTPEFATELLRTTRTAAADEVSAEVAKRVGASATAQSAWDGLFLGGAELLMRQPGIVALHSLTSLNALHYAARATGDAELRRFLLLQAAAFVPLFRDAMKSRGKVGDAKIDELGPRDEDAEFTVRDVYAELGRNKETAARTAFTVLKGNPGAAKALADEGRRLIFVKGTDSHDYKFSSAVLEDVALLSPGVRDRFLAASLFWLKGSGAPDSPLVKRTRAALA
ncbi:MAG: hypothetical protein C0501_27610 [Isosphaera sp.]|nr:hypothetical protein [Isosphaera sp.]